MISGYADHLKSQAACVTNAVSFENKKPAQWRAYLIFAAQFALTSRAYHNSITDWLTLQVKSFTICAERVTHWSVQHRFSQT